MATRSSLAKVSGVIAGVAILAGFVLGCEPTAGPGGSVAVAATPAGTASATTPVAAATPATSESSPADGPSATGPGRDAPPDALLAAEGGDPVAGELGTYVWLDSGSDSPWLPGAPHSVGAGEPLTITLVPDGEIRAWTARYVPAAVAGPEGATSSARAMERRGSTHPDRAHGRSRCSSSSLRVSATRATSGVSRWSEPPGGGTLPRMGNSLATLASRPGRRTAATLAVLLLLVRLPGRRRRRRAARRGFAGPDGRRRRRARRPGRKAGLRRTGGDRTPRARR